ncbi:MAG: DUF6508 domain-containing protein [Candidatus Xenobia bacterium]
METDGIVGFLQTFEHAEFRAAEWIQPPAGQMPYLRYHDTVNRFVAALYEHGWVDPTFNWTAWHGARQYVFDPELLKQADVETLRRLLTTHVRQERFVEGHLANLFDQGYIVAILRRLRELGVQE